MRRPDCHRGDIWWLDWSPSRGSEQAGFRPALIIQNDIGNLFSPTTIVAAITTRGGDYPFLVRFEPEESGLPQVSYANLAQILTVDRSRLVRKAGGLREHAMAPVEEALRLSLGLA